MSSSSFQLLGKSFQSFVGDGPEVKAFVEIVMIAAYWALLYGFIWIVLEASWEKGWSILIIVWDVIWFCICGANLFSNNSDPDVSDEEELGEELFCVLTAVAWTIVYIIAFKRAGSLLQVLSSSSGRQPTKVEMEA